MKPIIFNIREVQATLSGRMTAVWRVVKFPEGQAGRLPANGAHDHLFYPGGIKYPHYCLKDILYVQETFATLMYPNGRIRRVYKATDEYPFGEIGVALFRWNASALMPEEAARIFLRVTNVSFTKLHDIPLSEYLSNGALLSLENEMYNISAPVSVQERTIGAWNSTIKKADLPRYGWDANPWVEVTRFERISKEEAYKNG